jgi:hypothetical protein
LPPRYPAEFGHLRWDSPLPWRQLIRLLQTPASGEGASYGRAVYTRVARVVALPHEKMPPRRIAALRTVKRRRLRTNTSDPVERSATQPLCR